MTMSVNTESDTVTVIMAIVVGLVMTMLMMHSDRGNHHCH